jgi:hypothetical protein
MFWVLHWPCDISRHSFSRTSFESETDSSGLLLKVRVEILTGSLILLFSAHLLLCPTTPLVFQLGLP